MVAFWSTGVEIPLFASRSVSEADAPAFRARVAGGCERDEDRRNDEGALVYVP